MTSNKTMTGEQLDELMTVAVNMQRDAETDCNRPSAMFAYAVQVAVLELRKFRNDALELEQKLAESQREFRAADATIENMQMQVEKLAAENAGLKEYLAPAGLAVEGTPATDAFLAEVRAQGADECVRQLVISDDDDFSDAPNICAMVAYQLRKGGAAQSCPHCGGTGTCSDSGCTATDQMIEQYRNSKGVQS